MVSTKHRDPVIALDTPQLSALPCFATPPATLFCAGGRLRTTTVSYLVIPPLRAELMQQPVICGPGNELPHAIQVLSLKQTEAKRGIDRRTHVA